MFNFWPFKKKQITVAPQPAKQIKSAASQTTKSNSFGLPEITHYPPMPQVLPPRHVSDSRSDDTSLTSFVALHTMIYSSDAMQITKTSHESSISEVPEIKSYSTYTPPSDSDTTSRSSSYDFSSSSSSSGSDKMII